MAYELLYWHWIVFGIALVIFEIIAPSFTALWFGLGAIVVGLILLIAPAMSLTVQISLWAIISTALTFLWFKYLKPAKAAKDKATLQDVDGEIGLVINGSSSTKNGRVRFSTPILGIDEWAFSSTDPVNIGDSVQVIGIQDEVLIIVKK